MRNRAMLIDTHCHLNDPAFDPALPEVIDRAERSGVLSFVVPAYDRDSLRKTMDLSSLYRGRILPAYGIHPWYAADTINYDILLSYLRRENTVAVGEIGLDFTPHETPPEQLQIAAFSRQLDYARDLNLPVLIHCRKAHDAVYDILKTYHGGVRGVMHSFSGKCRIHEQISGSRSLYLLFRVCHKRNCKEAPQERSGSAHRPAARRDRCAIDRHRDNAGLSSRTAPHHRGCPEDSRAARHLFRGSVQKHNGKCKTAFSPRDSLSREVTGGILRGGGMGNLPHISGTVDRKR